jgi:lipopolysaccharide transport system ATP-binding protein
VNACNYCTATDGFPLPVLCGAGTLEVLTPPLKLVSESYTVHALIWDRKFEHLYSAQYGATFHVRHPLFSTHFGVFHEPAQWAWTHGDEPPRPKPQEAEPVQVVPAAD